MSDARRRAVVASLLGVCLHGGGLGAASPDGQDPCAGAAPALRQAAEALDKGQWAEAEGHLRPLQASHASCGGVALGLARLRAARGDAAEAERLFERATSLFPDDASSHALFGRYWLSRGQLARADYESSLALSLDRDCPEALVVSGQISEPPGPAPGGPTRRWRRPPVWAPSSARGRNTSSGRLVSTEAPRGSRPAAREGGRVASDRRPRLRLPGSRLRGAGRSRAGGRRLPEGVSGERRRSLLRFLPGLQLRPLPPQGEAPLRESVTPRPRDRPSSPESGGSLRESQAEPDARAIPGRARGGRARPLSRIPAGPSSISRCTTCSPPSTRVSGRRIWRGSTPISPARRRSPTRTEAPDQD